MVGNDTVISNHVLLAGHVRVRDGAIMNGASACHHFTTIGRLAYVGGLTRITSDVHPFTIVEGHPARVRAANTIGMRRSGMDEADVDRVKKAIHRIFVSDRQLSAEAIERTMGMLDDAQRAKVVGLNAARFLGIEVPEHQRLEVYAQA